MTTAARTRLVALTAGLLALAVGLSHQVPPGDRPRTAVADGGRPRPDDLVRTFGEARFRPAAGAVAFSPDGSRVATAVTNWHTTGHVWEFATGRPVATFAREDGWIAALGFTADGGALVVVGSETPPDRRVWPVDVRRVDARTGRELSQAALPGLNAARFLKAVVSADGRAVYAGTEDTPPGRYDPATGAAVWKLTLAAGERAGLFAASPDGRRLAVTAGPLQPAGRHVRILDAATGAEEGRFYPPGNFSHLAFSADGRTLAVGPGGHAVAATIWEVPTRTQRATVLGPVGAGQSLAFSPDGRWLAAGGWKDDVLVFDTATWAEWFRVWLRGANGPPHFAPGGAVLAVAAGGLGLWDVAARRPLPQSADLPRLWGYAGLAFDPDGRTLTGFDFNTPAAVTWEVGTGREVRRVLGDAAYAFEPWRLSPDRRFWLSFTTDPGGTTAVVAAADGREVGRFTCPPSEGWAVARLGAGGRYVYAADGVRVTQWDVGTGRPVGVLADFTSAGTFVSSPEGDRTYPNPDASPSPCGRYVAVYPRDWGQPEVPVRVLDPRTRAVVCEFRTDGPPELTWSADGGRLAVVTAEWADAGPGRRGLFPEWREKVWVRAHVTVRELPSGRVVSRATVADGLSPAAFGPDLRSFVGSSLETREEGVVRVYETATGRERHRFAAGTGWRGVCVFSPDGRYLATGHERPPVALWDVRGGPAAGGVAASWTALASDPPAAFRAVRALAASTRRAVRHMGAQPPPDGVQAVRAVEAAEWIATPGAVRLLEAWAAGPPDRVLTGEAASALARLRASGGPTRPAE